MERRTQNPPLFRQAISHSLQAEHALEGEDGDGEFERNKGPHVPRRPRARSSDYRLFAAHHNHNRRNKPSHPVLGEAWTRDASRQSINSRV